MGNCNSTQQTRSDDILKYYNLCEKLGSGTFAVVRRAERKSDNKEFAIKVIRKDRLSPEELAVVHDEVKIMRQVSHANCVKLYEIFETPKKIQMVMELLTGGELFDRIVQKGTFSEREAAELIKSVAQGIQYLHSINIVHRDLKPENLVYLTPDNDSLIKITDFGLAKSKPRSVSMTTACGTPQYVAPEIICNEPYDNKVDLWSLGVILYVLLCGFPPFYNESTTKLYDQIKAARFSFPDPYWKDVSSEAKDLVRRLLERNPDKRLSAAEVLVHPWIKAAATNTRSLGAEHAMRLKLLQAKKRLRKAVQVIIAVNKFGDVLTALAQDQRRGTLTGIKGKATQH